MGVFIRIAAARSVPRARAHIRYITFCSRELPGEERCAFDARSDHARVRTFLAGLDDPVNRHPMATKAYKFVLSLSGDEFAHCGLTSWKPVVREAMANLEARWDMKLDWIADLNADHPHCHLVLRASYPDGAGRRRQQYLPCPAGQGRVGELPPLPLPSPARVAYADPCRARSRSILRRRASRMNPSHIFTARPTA